MYIMYVYRTAQRDLVQNTLATLEKEATVACNAWMAAESDEKKLDASKVYDEISDEYKKNGGDVMELPSLCSNDDDRPKCDDEILDMVSDADNDADMDGVVVEDDEGKGEQVVVREEDIAQISGSMDSLRIRELHRTLTEAELQDLYVFHCLSYMYVNIIHVTIVLSDERVICFNEGIRKFINSMNVDYMGQVDFLFTDIPWSVLTKKGSRRDDDKFYSTDVQPMCDHIAKMLTKTGSGMIRLAVQQWSVWEEALQKAHMVTELLHIWCNLLLFYIL